MPVRYSRMASVFLAHPSSLEHDTGGHPEQPARITAIERELAARDWLRYERVGAPGGSRACAAGGGHLDMDTIVSRGSFEAALHACGGAARMAELLVSGSATRAFSA